MATTLTTLGIAHTVFSLVAIGCGVVALATRGVIDPRQRLGTFYVITTVLTTGSALAIFNRGSFGPGHALAIVALLTLGIALVATCTTILGRFSRTIQTASMSATLLFHAIPGVTEGLTRLPPSVPVFASPEAPEFKTIYAGLLALFVIGLGIQLWRQQRRART